MEARKVFREGPNLPFEIQELKGKPLTGAKSQSWVRGSAWPRKALAPTGQGSDAGSPTCRPSGLGPSLGLGSTSVQQGTPQGL